jgi:site-specific recombinase XerD
MTAERAASISPYDFRHSRLTFLGEHTANLPGLQFIAGHKHATTTAKYIRPSVRAAEEVYAAILPGKPKRRSKKA